MNVLQKVGIVIALSVVVIGGGIYSIDRDRVNSTQILNERNKFEETTFKNDLSQIDNFKKSLLKTDEIYKLDVKSLEASRIYLETLLDRIGYKEDIYEKMMNIKLKNESFKLLDDAIAQNKINSFTVQLSDKEYEYYKKTFQKLKEQSNLAMNEDKDFVNNFLNKGSYYKKIGAQMVIAMEKKYDTINHLTEVIDFILKSKEQSNKFVDFKPTQLKISHILLTSNSHPEINVSKTDCEFLEKLNNSTWIEDNNIKCSKE
jgi:hypothetical protein